MIMYEDIEKGIVVQEAASQDPSIAHIRLHNSEAYRIAANLIANSQAEVDESDKNAQPQPFEFAGQHGGMPRYEVWAMTRDESAVQPHLEAIVGQLHQAYDALVKVDEV